MYNSQIFTTATLLFAVIGVAVALISSSPTGIVANTTNDLLSVQFIKFISKYNKRYESNEHADRRFAIYSHNIKNVINVHNEEFSRGLHTWTMAENQYADWTFEEFKEYFKLKNGFGAEQDCSATLSPKKSYYKTLMSSNGNNGIPRVPQAKDWRQSGVVSPVKNQGNCGSCWAFSSTGALESHFALRTNKLLSLSEQQLVDCAGAFDNNGCDGGLPSHAFEYIRYLGEHGGLETELTYPYKAVDQKCQYNPNFGVVKTRGSYNITEGDEDELVSATYINGPVSVAYQVVEDFRFYKSGVYQSNVCQNGPKDVNHAVLVVGYNSTSEGVPYYIIKNSWGVDFGMNGYFYMIRNKNMCGVATCSSFPIVRD